MESKEECMLKLFFENPSREWHFEEMLSNAKITRSKASKWLRKFNREGLIKRVKERGKMPYYKGNCESPAYQNRKKLFALSLFYESGLLNHLSSLKKARAVIIFGSFSRWDWHKNSDIDLFIYGEPEGLKIAKYEMKLHRDIQVFACRSKKELARLGSGLMRNIIKGDIIKGDIDFVRVESNA